MACVWKHPKSPYWTARFSNEAGVVVNRSTRTTNQKEAKAIASGWEHAARLAREGALTTDKARGVVSEILERISGGAETIRSEKAEDFFTRWLSVKEATRSGSATVARYRTVVGLFMESLGERRSRPLTAIRTSDVQDFLTARSKNRSAKTVSVDAKIITAAFAFAVRQGALSRNPALGVELQTVKSKERTPFTAIQIRQLIEAAPSADWKTCILAGYYTGARLSDIVTMQWTALDLVAGTWTYQQRKTGEETTTPLHPVLAKHLEQIAGDASGFVMPSLADRGTGGEYGLSNQFNRIMREAGISQDRVKQKSGRTFASLTFHSLRHSFETDLASAGVSAEMRRELIGRADEVTQRVYTHHQIATMREALGKLPEL